MSELTSHWQAELEHCLNEHLNIVSCAGLKNRCLGLENSDRRLWQLGQQWLLHHGHSLSPVMRGKHEGPDVYLTTQLYTTGGHTALIGDFVRALHDPNGTSPHLIVTNLHGQNSEPVSEAILQRIAITPGAIHVLPEGRMVEKLGSLFETLIRLKPARLFLFHHPDDPLPVAVAQHAIARQHVLVHHADATPSFGLHLPGVVLIDLHPTAAAMTRLQGLSPHLLPLTCPDPGPRTEGFLKQGHLVTATSGSLNKYRTPYHLSYAETVAIILQTTGGKHVHIGPLEDTDLNTIQDAMLKHNVSLEGFVHVPWAASVAEMLWEHACDLYVSSFPINGARTNAEVVASATPHLSHSLNPLHNLQSYELSIDGGLVWKDWPELIKILHDINDVDVLKKKSRQARAMYERVHHPAVFSTLLNSILDDQGGWHDSREVENERQAARALFRSINQALLQQQQLLKDEKEQGRKRLESLKAKLSALEDRQKKLQKDLAVCKTKKPGIWKKFINKLRGK